MTVQTHMAWQYRNPADLIGRKWHQAGYSLDEISPLVPQVPKEEIKAIIQQHHE